MGLAFDFGIYSPIASISLEIDADLPVIQFSPSASVWLLEK